LDAARAGNQPSMSSDSHREVDAAAKDMESGAEELQERVENLDDDIDDSRRKLEEMRQKLGDRGDNVAGDWEDTDDAAGGEDPKGAA
jgi:predicted  nucleic acid-binding Zn-ribbon protein